MGRILQDKSRRSLEISVTLPLLLEHGNRPAIRSGLDRLVVPVSPLYQPHPHRRAAAACPIEQLHRVHDRQIRGAGTLENSIYIARSTLEEIDLIRAVGEEAAVGYEITEIVDCRQPKFCSEFDDPFTNQKWISLHADNSLRPGGYQRSDGGAREKVPLL